MSYFHCGNGYPDRCNGYKGPLDERVCTSPRHRYDESGRQIPDPVPQLHHRIDAPPVRVHRGGCLDQRPLVGSEPCRTCGAVPEQLPRIDAAEEIEQCRSQYGKPGMTAGEFERFLPDHLKQPYWRQKIEEYFRAEGLDPDA